MGSPSPTARAQGAEHMTKRRELHKEIVRETRKPGGSFDSGVRFAGAAVNVAKKKAKELGYLK